jgi:hypothetical protein
MVSSISSPFPGRRPVDWRELFTASPVATVILFALLLLAIVPVAYLGGDGDDYHYLLAARCVADHGFCLPVDHWWRRYPIVFPTGISLALFGESQASLSIAPLAYSLSALALFVTLVQRQFGRVEALLAGLALACTPAFAMRLPEVNIDIPELTFVLAALLCLQSASASGKRRLVVLAGVMLGFAIQARPTSLVMVPIVMIGLVAMKQWRGWTLPLIAGVLIPNLGEAILYWLYAGDPLLPWRLSLAHSHMPSSDLVPGVDTGRSPLFNPNLIGGWKHANGISVHWTVDGLLNLVVDPSIALTLACGALFAASNWRALIGARDGKLLLALAIGAALLFGGLTYGFAIAPRPRMYLAIIALFCVYFGVFAARSLPARALLVSVATLLLVGKALSVAYDRADLRAEAMIAPAWVAAAHGNVAIDPRTGRFLTLVPGIDALPRYAPGIAADRILLIGQDDCRQAADDVGLQNWHAERAATFRRHDPVVIATLRRSGLFLGPPLITAMCLLRRD